MTAKTLFIVIAFAASGFGQDNPQPAAQPENKIVDADGKPLSNAKVTLKSADGKSFEISTDDHGTFSANVPVEIGKYKTTVTVAGVTVDKLISIIKPKEPATTAAAATPPVTPAPAPAPAAGNTIYSLLVPSTPAKIGWLAALLLFLFWLIALVARYYNIVKVNHARILAAIDTTLQDVAAATNPDIQARARQLAQEAQAALDNSDGFKTFVFGMRGQIAAAWVRLDEAERILAACYTRDQAISRLRIVVEQLKPEYSKIAEKIEAVLATANVTDDFLRATLCDGLRCLNEKEELATDSTLNWQNKAFTLIFIGICLLTAMAVLLPDPVLLLVGFAGGFASRLMRGKGDNKPADADLNWTTLFLSPMYGAFAAWAGVILLIVLRQLNVLSELFDPVKAEWERGSPSTMTFGLAFLFGFSERFFSAVTDLAEKTVVKGQNATAADSPGANNAAGAANAGIPAAPAPPQNPPNPLIPPQH